MSILNTFWILFKSNADDVIKGNKAIEKSTKETESALKNTNEEAHKLGESFVKMVETGAAAAGAWAGFKILENGVKTATEYNTQLALMAKLTGQNAQTLKTFAQAAAEAGGTRQGALADMAGFFKLAESMGVQGAPIDKIFDAIRGRMKNMNDAQKRGFLGQAGINDPGDRLRLMMSEADYSSTLRSAAEVTPFDQASQDKARDFTRSQEHLAGAQGDLYTTIGNKLIPAINALVDKISNLINGAAGSGGTALAAGGLFTALKAGEFALGAGIGLKLLKGAGAAVLGRGAASTAAQGAVDLGYSLNGTATAAGAGGAGLMATGAVGAGGLLVGGGLGYGLVSLFSEPIERALTRWQERDIKPTPTLAANFKKGGSDLDFWMGKGYSREQALGIMSNMMAESKGNPRATGDGGRALGLFQWHPDRRASILKNTGIDISTASYQQQLEAAAWEMKNGRPGFNDSHFRTLQDAGAAASYFSKRFESPADIVGQAVARGRTALAMASQATPFSGTGGGNSVRIEKIEVVTQATDASGIAKDLKEALYTSLSNLQANVDDGVAR